MRIFLMILALIIAIGLIRINFFVVLTNDRKYFRFNILFFSISNSKKSEKKIEENTEEKEKKSKKRKKSKKSSEKKAIEKDTGKEKSETKEKKENPVKTIIEILNENRDLIKFGLHEIYKFLARLVRESEIKKLKIIFSVCEDDTYETAKKYVQLNQIIYPTVGFLSQFTNIEIKHIRIETNFTGEETEYHISFRYKFAICNLIHALFMAAIAYMKVLIYLKTENEKLIKIKNTEGKMDKENQVKKNSNETKQSNVSNLTDVTMEKVRNMVDTDTVIGEQIKVSENTSVIPVSKVTYGFGSGGSDIGADAHKNMFAGGAGAGITVKPIGFLVINGDDVRMLQLNESGSNIDSIIAAVPSVITQVTDLFGKFKKGKKEESSDNSEEQTEDKAE